MTEVNGQVQDRAAIEQQLTGEPLTEGYRPTLPTWLWTYVTESVPQFYLMRDIELMMVHPVVLSRLNYFKSGVANAEFDIVVENDGQGEVTKFIDQQCKEYWNRGVPKLQGGYEYGWIGCEPLYRSDNGPLEWTDFVQFAPRDTYLLTRSRRPIGVRVNQIPEIPGKERPHFDGKSGANTVDLWLASRDVPAKGVWYAHRPRYSQYYGQSQLLGAWRPWRRLAWKDGAETNVDGGFYRFFFGGLKMKYPEEDIQGSTQQGSVNTTTDSQGRPQRFARDIARQIAEQFKSGATIGIPSTHYPNEFGGGPKWEADMLETKLDLPGGIVYIKHLWDQISYGVGVPPELFETGESGSGYSGRAIPVESFLTMQQHIADALLALFIDQILRPLIYWNWGYVKFSVKVKNLLQMKRMAQQGEQGVGGTGQEKYEGRFPGRPLDPDGQRQQGTAPQATGVPDNGWTALSVHRPVLVTNRAYDIARKIAKAA